MHVHRAERYLERRKIGRPDDAVVVMILFDTGGNCSADADAVAAHEDDLFLAVGIEESGIKRLGVFGAELEDMADFDAAPHLQNAAAAARAGIAVGDIADIGKLRQRKVTFQVDVFQVIPIFVGAADKVAQSLDGLIGNDANLQADRAEIAAVAPVAVTICSSVAISSSSQPSTFFSLISLSS